MPHAVLLDAGCGDDFPLLDTYAPQVSFGVGIDRVRPARPRRGNVSVVVGDLGTLPFGSGVFDLVVSRSVVEHLAEPVAAFRELRRVIKPGGKLMFTTPNRYYYSSLIARAIPYSWKGAFLRWVFGETAYDDFPVFYRANSRGALRRLAAQTGLRIAALQAVRHFPHYFLFSPTLFRLGILYDWLITWLRLDDLQSNWLVVMERTD